MSATGATLGVAMVVLVAAYIVWPKPTLLVFALLLILYHTLARWPRPDCDTSTRSSCPVLFVAAASGAAVAQGLIDPLRDGALLVLFVAGRREQHRQWRARHSLAAGARPARQGLRLPVYRPVARLQAARRAPALPARAGRRDLRGSCCVPSRSPRPPISVEPQPDRLSSTPRGPAERQAPSPAIPPVRWFSAFVALFLSAGYVVFRRWWLLIGAGLFGMATVLVGPASGDRRLGSRGSLQDSSARFTVRTLDRRVAGRAWARPGSWWLRDSLLVAVRPGEADRQRGAQSRSRAMRCTRRL